jgi:hypothetical protein
LRRPHPLALASALIAAALTCTTASTARGAEQPERVLIRSPERGSALLGEAIIRVRGELSALGLSSDLASFGEITAPGDASEGVRGELTFEEDGPFIRIRAFGPAASSGVTEELDTRVVGVTAEVVAVRAVETLRAALTGSNEKPRTAPARPEPPPQPIVVTPSPRTHELSLAPSSRGALSIWAGPTSSFDPGSRQVGLGGELGLFYGQSSCFGGVAAHSTWPARALHESEGRVDLRRIGALGRLGCTLTLSPAVELWVTVGGGVARYHVEGYAAPGYVGRRHHHDSPVVALGVGATAWFSPVFGAYLRLEGSYAVKAPALDVNYREVATLERPAVWLSTGLVVEIGIGTSR